MALPTYLDRTIGPNQPGLRTDSDRVHSALDDRQLARRFFIDPVDGVDSNDGLFGLETKAFATAQYAVAAIRAEGIDKVCIEILPHGDLTIEEPIIAYEGTEMRSWGPLNTDKEGGRIVLSGGFVGDAAILSKSWSDDTNYGHFLRIHDLAFVLGGMAAAVGVRGLGENSLLDRLVAFDAGPDGAYWLTGTHAVGHVSNLAAFDSVGPIMKLGAHPTRTLGPAAGVAGNVRIFGLSGDRNGEGTGCSVLYHDGNYAVDLIGLKHESTRDAGDAVIVMHGGGTGGGRAALFVSGRADATAGAGVTGDDFIRIENNARPELTRGALHITHFTNYLNDEVAGRVIPLANSNAPGVPYYSSDGASASWYVAGDHNIEGRVTITRASLSRLTVETPNDGYEQTLRTQFSGTETYNWMVGADGASIMVVDGNGGQSVRFRGWTGSTMEDRLKLNSAGTHLGLNGKVGFFGATPVDKPTGVAVDAASVHAALVSLGLIAA